MGGKEYPEGIGVHAKSTIIYDLPEGYDRLEAIGGLDNSGSDQGDVESMSIQFCVYTEPIQGAVTESGFRERRSFGCSG